MAVYTELSKPFLKELADDYGLGRVTGTTGIPEGSVNSNYVLEAAKGKFLLRVDEVKGENELKREIDLLSFLRKHAFPCPPSEAGSDGPLLPQLQQPLRVAVQVPGRQGARAGADEAEPARDDRPRARRPARDRQGLQKGNRQPLQLRANRRSVPDGAQPAAQLLSQDLPHARRRGRVPDPIPRGQAAQGRDPRRHLLRQPVVSRREDDRDARFRRGVPRQVHFRYRDRGQRVVLRRRRVLARPLPLPALRLRGGADAVACRMGRVSQRAAIFVAAVHGDTPARLLSLAGRRQESRGQRLP